MENVWLAEILIVLALFVVAILYSSVGHGGASGYLAVMAFLSIAPNVTKPPALILNIFVASIGAFQFYRAGYFDWRVFAPFAVASVPLAFLGGMISLPTQIYRPLLGAILLFAAFRLAWDFTSEKPIVAPSVWLALLIGAIIGFLYGLVGVGGGLFITQVLLTTNRTETQEGAEISAMMKLVTFI